MILSVLAQIWCRGDLIASFAWELATIKLSSFLIISDRNVSVPFGTPCSNDRLINDEILYIIRLIRVPFLLNACNYFLYMPFFSCVEVYVITLWKIANICMFRECRTKAPRTKAPWHIFFFILLLLLYS